MNKYKLKTNDTLKCAACGNKEFTETRVEGGSHPGMAGKECWIYICGDCGHVMAFTSKAEIKEGIL